MLLLMGRYGGADKKQKVVVWNFYIARQGLRIPTSQITAATSWPAHPKNSVSSFSFMAWAVSVWNSGGI
jgi:hypothetical protein